MNYAILCKHVFNKNKGVQASSISKSCSSCLKVHIPYIQTTREHHHYGRKLSQNDLWSRTRQNKIKLVIKLVQSAKVAIWRRGCEGRNIYTWRLHEYRKKSWQCIAKEANAITITYYIFLNVVMLIRIMSALIIHFHASARSRSAIISCTLSKPTDILTTSSPAPHASRCSEVN